MNLIVAISDNFGIGKDGDLLFKVREDQKYFRAITTGKTVVMGRKTYMSLPNSRALPNRRNIVLSTDKSFAPSDAEVCHNLEELKDMIKDIPRDEVFIIGGEQIYRALIEECDKLYVTCFHASPCADTYFPDFQKNEKFKLTEKSDTHYDGELSFEFCIYTNIKCL